MDYQHKFSYFFGDISISTEMKRVHVLYELFNTGMIAVREFGAEKWIMAKICGLRFTCVIYKNVNK